MKRSALWKDGEVTELLREGRTIQKRLFRSHRKAQIFAKLVMEGQINSALRYLNAACCGAELSLTDDFMKQLNDKHPKAQPAKLESLLFGPIEEVHESACNEITSQLIMRSGTKN